MSNPTSSAMSYMNQIPAQLQKYLGPYIDAGNAEIPGLTDQYNQLMTDPGARLNQIGAGYQQSPGFDFAMQQSLQGANNAAAAGGMAGSPQHEQQNMTLATNLADQDYNQWMGNALGLYKTGLSGGQDIYNTGAKTSMAMGEDMSSVLAQQAKLSYMGDLAKQQQSSSMWGALAGGAATGASYAIFSSAALKEKISTPSTKEILDNVRDLSLDKWKYKDIPQAFLGTYAEEFAERFGVGDGKTINLIDAIGVLLGAVKELDKRIIALQEEKNANSIS